MRTALILILLFVITLPTFAQLTQQDLEKIGNLVDRKLEPVKLDIAEMKGKMATKDDLTNMRKDFSEEMKSMRKDFSEELKSVKLDVTEMKGKMATKDDIITVQRELSSKMIVLTTGLLTAWITIIAAIITIPYLYGRADRERVKQVEADVRELSKLRAEVESLKAIKEAEEKRRESARKIAEEKPEFAEAYRMLGLL